MLYKIGHWSCGYGRRLKFHRSWVWIPAPYSGWTWHFFRLICCKNCYDVCLKRPKINQKVAGVGPFIKTFFFWNEALRFDVASHMSSLNQLECFILTLSSYAVIHLFLSSAPRPQVKNSKTSSIFTWKYDIEETLIHFEQKKVITYLGTKII